MGESELENHLLGTFGKVDERGDDRKRLWEQPKRAFSSIPINT